MPDYLDYYLGYQDVPLCCGCGLVLPIEDSRTMCHTPGECIQQLRALLDRLEDRVAAVEENS